MIRHQAIAEKGQPFAVPQVMQRADDLGGETGVLERGLPTRAPFLRADSDEVDLPRSRVVEIGEAKRAPVGA